MKDIAIPSAESSALTPRGLAGESIGRAEPGRLVGPRRWHLRSDWSPRDLEAFITFLVDPQDSHPGNSSLEYREVWAIVASTSIAQERMTASSMGHVLPLGHGWKARIPALMSYLSEVRGRHAI